MATPRPPACQSLFAREGREHRQPFVVVHDDEQQVLILLHHVKLPRRMFEMRSGDEQWALEDVVATRA